MAKKPSRKLLIIIYLPSPHHHYPFFPSPIHPSSFFFHHPSAPQACRPWLVTAPSPADISKNKKQESQQREPFFILHSSFQKSPRVRRVTGGYKLEAADIRAFTPHLLIFLSFVNYQIFFTISTAPFLLSSSHFFA